MKRVKIKNCVKRITALTIAFSVGVSMLPTVPIVSAKDYSNGVTVVYSAYSDQEKTEYKLSGEKQISFSDAGYDDNTISIVVDPSITYQTWEGFGGSLDGASVYKILGLSSENQNHVLNDLFNTESGNAYNYMRLSIGCSDFTINSTGVNGVSHYDNVEGAGTGYWTYDDVVDEDTNGDGILDADMDLSNFSIEKEKIGSNDQIGLLKRIQAINPDVKFFASMWSAPAWMKKNESLIWQQGQVDPEIKEDYYDVLAEYYCKYIKAYQNEGIIISAVTLQNEPDIKIGYPCTIFTPENQIRFATILGQKFEEQGLDVEIWGLDANEFETWSYAVPLLESEAAEYVDGIGYHNYGNITMYYPEVLRQAYPDTTYHITEMTVGAKKLIEYMRNWISSYAYWITYYDIDTSGNRQYGPGPSFWSTPQSDDADHWSMSQITDDGKGSYTYSAKYYMFGQFSRYIDEGAVRIDSSEADGNVSNVAFQNPDGSIALVVSNRRTDVSGTNVAAYTPDQVICIQTPEGNFYDTIPGDTVATYTWTPSTGQWLNKTDWTVSASDCDSRYSTAQAVDSNRESFFTTGVAQSKGQNIVVDLKESENFDQVTLYQPDSMVDDYPASYTVSVSNDKQNWSTVASGVGIESLVTNIHLNQRAYARYIKITLNGSKEQGNWWTIGDIAVFDSQASLGVQTTEQLTTLNNKDEWSVQASSNRSTDDYINAIVDGNPDTSWIYQAAQEAGYYFIVDMGSIKHTSTVEINFGSKQDYARGYQLYTSKDGNTWTKFGEEQSLDETIPSGEMCIHKVKNSTNVSARYIKVALTKSVSNHYLQVNEVSVYEDSEAAYANRSTWSSSASNNTYEAFLMYDGQSGSDAVRWTNREQQYDGQWVQIEFGNTTTFNTISIDSGTDYARGMRILAQVNGSDYQEVYNGSGTEGIQTILLDKAYTADRIRIMLTKNYSTAYWSIYELNVGNSEENSINTADCKAYTKDHKVYENYAIDGNPSTVWVSSETQTASDRYTTAFLINLGGKYNISGIALNSGMEMWSYLEDCEIYAWTNDNEAKLVATVKGREGVTYAYFEPTDAQYIWIKAGSSSTNGRRMALGNVDVYLAN